MIESLEARVAPAAVFVNATTATYTDVDGDKVTVKFSKPVLDAGNIGAVLVTAPVGAGDQLQVINLTGPLAASPQKTNISVTVTRVVGGDGLANVGAINATDINLGAVAIKGDLGAVDAGLATAGTPAIAKLSVRSMGLYGLATQGGGGDLQSDIHGRLGALTVAKNIREAFIHVFGESGAIGAVNIGGSLIGGASSSSGQIFAEADIGPVRIGHDIVGGSASGSGSIRSDTGNLGAITIGGSIIGGSGGSSGRIFANHDIASVKIGGDLRGGSATYAGEIFAGFGGGKMGPVKIGGSIIGGAGESTGELYANGGIGAVTVGGDIKGGLDGGSFRAGRVFGGSNLVSLNVGGSVIGGSRDGSGSVVASNLGPVKIGGDLRGGGGIAAGNVEASGNIASVSIGGSVIGGTGPFAGDIRCSGDLGPVKIGGDLVGGSISGTTPTLNGSGYIEAGKRITSIFIGGSIVAGTDSSTAGELVRNASIRAGDNIGQLIVKGSVVGNVNVNGDTRVIISARGQAEPSATTDVAIGKVSIGGTVSFAQVLAGYDRALTPQNGGAQIGSVNVGGDWIASSIVAGSMNLGADDAPGGTGVNADNVNFGDVHDTGIGPSSVINRIASIIIRGAVGGTPQPGDHFGFSASIISFFKSGGFIAPLTASPNLIELSPVTGDVTIRELP